MITLDEAVEELYVARSSDIGCGEVESDKVRFLKQVHGGFRARIFDLSYMQCGMSVLARVPKIFRLLPTVRSFQLYNNLIRDSGFQKVYQILQANPQIVILDVGANDLSDGSSMCMLDVIKKTKIESLQIGRREASLQENRYSKEGLITIMDTIAEKNSIKCFGMSGIPLAKQKKTSKAKEFAHHIANLLVKCTVLENLDISWCGLVDSDQSTLCEGFMDNKNLKILSIANNDFKHGCRIIDGICSLSRLRSLNLSSCKLKEDSAFKIAERFQEGWGLVHLNLSFNQIGTAGVARLLNVLCNNDTLTELNLCETGIGSVIADHLRDFLVSTRVLRELDLSRNNIGGIVSSVFAEVLPSQETIVKLNLSNCRITDQGAADICAALATNTTMHRLSLKDNFVSQQGGIELIKILKENETLTSIDVSSNQLDCFGLDAINTLMARNRQSAQYKHLSDLRRNYIKLSIQKAKIPGLVDELSDLNHQDDQLSEEIGHISDKLLALDQDTAGSIDVLKKTAEEFEKMIQQEKETVEQFKEKTLEAVKEGEANVNEIKERTEREKQLVTKLELDSTNVETEITKFTESSKTTEQKLREEIRVVEEMIREISERMADPDELRIYEIPDYPYPDEQPKHAAPELEFIMSSGTPDRETEPVVSVRSKKSRKPRVKKPTLKKKK